MTEEQIEGWKTERDIARSIVDKAERDIALVKVYDHRDDMMLRCIAHQSSRTKILVDDVDKIKKELAPCVESDRDYRANKLKASGMVLLWKILKYLVAAGGGAALLKALS